MAATDAASREFHVKGTVAFVMLTKHAGGTWTVEMKSPDDEWVDIDQDFDGNGVKAIHAENDLAYRVTGGTQGATAWVIDNRENFYR